MRGGLLLAGLCAAAAPASAAAREGDAPEIREEISIKGRAPSGPAVQLPRAGPTESAAEEVIRSLDLYKTAPAARTPTARVPAASKRFSRPFPEPPYLSLSPRVVGAPHDSWVFEVLSGGETVWRVQGRGRLQERLDWDGTGAGGEMVMKVGRPYHFRFTGRRDGGEFVLTSDPVSLRSLVFREPLGSLRLEVDNAVLFEPGKAGFGEVSDPYLDALENLLRRSRPGPTYRFVLRDPKPEGRTAKTRASALKSHFAGRLLINPEKISVEIYEPGDRGEVTACILPPEEGERIPTGL